MNYGNQEETPNRHKDLISILLGKDHNAKARQNHPNKFIYIFQQKRDIHSNSICCMRVQNVTLTFCIRTLSLKYTVACAHEHSRFGPTIFKFSRFNVIGCFYAKCYNNLPFPQVERVYGTMAG
jgi:hypothetical protein